MQKLNHINKNQEFFTRSTLRVPRYASSGYIALISAIIITTIMTLISLITSNVSFLGRFDTQTVESKSISHNVAMGCLDHARLKLSMGLYNGNETVEIDSYECEIFPIETSGANKIIKVQAIVSDKTTNLKLTINGLSFATVSLEEVTSF